MGDPERALCWMTCFQRGSLTSSRIIGITQGILCALIIIAVCFFSLLSLAIFHCQSVYWFPCLFLLLIDVTMLITILLLCMFCRILQKAGLIFHQRALPIHAVAFISCIWGCAASWLLKSFMYFSSYLWVWRFSGSMAILESWILDSKSLHGIVFTGKKNVIFTINKIDVFIGIWT